MDLNDLHPPDDYSHRFFIWHEWIKANEPLTIDNVFDYFATSMFYDKQSNNQVLRMQTMHTGMPVVNEAEELKRFTGVEFALVHAQAPSMFIIQKRERLSPDEVRPLAVYFVMNKRIYQSPDLYTVLSNRLLTSICSLQTSLDILRRHRPDYTPRTGFVWPIADVSQETSKKNDPEEGVSTMDAESSSDSALAIRKTGPVSGVPKKQENNMLLMNAMRATAAHTKQSLSSRTLGPTTETQMDISEGPGIRNSATPAPSSTPQAATPKALSNAPPSEIPPKAPAGAGKKKRKRTSLAAPPMA